METEPKTYDLNELAEAAGVTARTIRYYVAQGILPSPATRGPGTRYDAGHLDRLQLIKRLQRQHLPLAEIRRQLEGLDDAGVKHLLRVAPQPTGAATALSYVRELLSATEPKAAREREPDASVTRFTRAASSRGFAESIGGLFKAESRTVQEPTTPASPTPRQSVPGRSAWDRIALSPDIELHVRRPLSRAQNRQVEQLLDAARHIFAEES